MSDVFWPPTIRELFPDNRADSIYPDDFKDYRFKEGERGRYKKSGWQKAIRIGIAPLDMRAFGAAGGCRE